MAGRRTGCTANNCKTWILKHFAHLSQSNLEKTGDTTHMSLPRKHTINRRHTICPHELLCIEDAEVQKTLSYRTPYRTPSVPPLSASIRSRPVPPCPSSSLSVCSRALGPWRIRGAEGHTPTPSIRCARASTAFGNTPSSKRRRCSLLIALFQHLLLDTA